MYTSEQTSSTAFYCTSAQKTPPIYQASYSPQKRFNQLIKNIENTHFFSKEIKEKLLSEPVKKALQQQFENDKASSIFLEKCYSDFKHWGLKPYNSNLSDIKINLNEGNYLPANDKIIKKLVIIPYKAFCIFFPNVLWDVSAFNAQNWKVCFCTKNTVLNQNINNFYVRGTIKLAAESYTKQPLKCFIAEEIK